ncbi:MAG TPA: SPOR domain-containing protein [Gemmatimonadales bacterium]|nr:SPOR domain-containing protein [Gemmatimonadales bacterium]
MRLGARRHPGTGAREWLVALFAVPVCACAAAPAALAQDNPALRNAVALAAEGLGDSARRIVATELAKAKPGDPAYIEALYWRGRLATSGDSAERDLRRVAIEYSTSRWADQALLQLAQLAMAAGNGAGALQLAERLRSDYPTSLLRARAALWAGRAAFDLGDPATACAMLDSASAEAAGDVEFQNQVAYYHGRCAALPPPAPADTTHPAQPPAADTSHAAPGAPAAKPSAPDTARPPAPRPASQFDVQVEATHTNRAAQAVLARVTRAGERARVVRGADGFYRVRAGPYATERAATAAAAKLKKALGGHPFVVPAS